MDGNRDEINTEADYERLGSTITRGTIFWMNHSSVKTINIGCQGKDIKLDSLPFNPKKPKEIAKKIAESIVKEIQESDGLWRAGCLSKFQSK
ncbi:MAG: hypothetical protein ACON5K_11230 [Bacteroidia bacterium]